MVVEMAKEYGVKSILYGVAKIVASSVYVSSLKSVV